MGETNRVIDPIVIRWATRFCKWSAIGIDSGQLVERSLAAALVRWSRGDLYPDPWVMSLAD